jgi:hypothetical protein
MFIVNLNVEYQHVVVSHSCTVERQLHIEHDRVVSLLVSLTKMSGLVHLDGHHAKIEKNFLGKVHVASSFVVRIPLVVRGSWF